MQDAVQTSMTMMHLTMAVVIMTLTVSGLEKHRISGNLISDNFRGQTREIWQFVIKITNCRRLGDKEMKVS